MVDANGGYSPAQARRVGAVLDDLGVVWFEEPVSSDDTDGLAALRHARALRRRRRRIHRRPLRRPPPDAGGGLPAARRHPMRRLQRLAGRRTSPPHTTCTSPRTARRTARARRGRHPDLRHIEYFIDHARLEAQLFDGVPTPVGGQLNANGSRPGHGVTLAPRAERYRQPSI